MAALSDYLESGLLHHIFRGQSFSKPSNIAIALCSGVPTDSDTGSTIPEMSSGDGVTKTGYARLDLGNPSTLGDIKWDYTTEDHAAGSGLIKNKSAFLFDEGEGTAALTDWGWVSGIAVVDSESTGRATFSCIPPWTTLASFTLAIQLSLIYQLCKLASNSTPYWGSRL